MLRVTSALVKLIRSRFFPPNVTLSITIKIDSEMAKLRVTFPIRSGVWVEGYGLWA